MLLASLVVMQWFSNWGPRSFWGQKINTTLLKKKVLCKIKFSGNLFFPTKLNKHNLELW